jgi:nucleotide-binding universal stress UspA family protein
MKNILLPVDFASTGVRVNAVALELARSLGAKLWFLHVAAPDPDFVGFSTGPQYIRDHRAEVLRQEHADLQEMAAQASATGADAEALLIQGPTTESILKQAKRIEADVIVMGSHGRGALYKAFVGSVSEQVLERSPIPVLIVPVNDRQ